MESSAGHGGCNESHIRDGLRRSSLSGLPRRTRGRPRRLCYRTAGPDRTPRNQLALSGPQNSATVRVAAYAAKLRAAVIAKPGIFCAKAFESDPWGVASTLVEWRDTLVSAGWKAQSCNSARVDDLALVEEQAPQLPSGPSDRLCAVFEALESQPVLRLESISLVEQHDCLPVSIRRLMRCTC